MRATFRDNNKFEDMTGNVQEYLEVNLMGVPTERERSVLKDGGSVWRAGFRLRK